MKVEATMQGYMFLFFFNNDYINLQKEGVGEV